jgi:hypothetical protein
MVSRQQTNGRQARMGVDFLSAMDMNGQSLLSQQITPWGTGGGTKYQRIEEVARGELTKL